MINFYVFDYNSCLQNKIISNVDDRIYFEKINLRHLRFYKIITVVAYYNLLRFFRVIKKDVYISYVIDSNSVISYAICYPKSFKYPFMEEDEYQIGSVFTDPRYRKKGYSGLIIKNILQNIKCKRIWYLTESDNIASINLCKKLNFNYFSKGTRSNNKFLSFLSIYKITD